MFQLHLHSNATGLAGNESQELSGGNAPIKQPWRQASLSLGGLFIQIQIWLNHSGVPSLPSCSCDCFHNPPFHAVWRGLDTHINRIIKTVTFIRFSSCAPNKPAACQNMLRILCLLSSTKPPANTQRQPSSPPQLLITAHFIRRD